ncbi:helix-turn-helix transcriptional regulator [Microtetraspora sp. AC03309]|uniref:helix-turn-helix domain-containing protein n=1 Tax=Microtetraspora sp. AC03309 TaxID=2779376 RepID=UPI001E3A19EA|nr:helix-turn-helix transcriptional regulator [Microtetraspora sp. AC03309]MCC5581558.1 helix-turn-helix transcriptional regulator [Microtetraspora sp. AC03309]
MREKITGARRREIDRAAKAILLESLRRGLATEETVDRIRQALPEVLPLEAWRFAHGWTRSEVSARLDMLYTSDGLAPPGIDQATLCRWEHGERRPSDERIEYLCRLYRTRPDRLGFGVDHSPADVDHLQRTGIIDAFPYTCSESEADLIQRLEAARERINMFGLTRNFYGRDEVLSVFEKKAETTPVQIFVMDPYCESRRDRYRVEPAEAAMEDPDRYVREVLRPLYEVALTRPNLKIFLYNFPCSYAIEEVDDACRVMLYGHGKRGTQGPIITFSGNTSAHTHFTDQIRWLERLSRTETPPEPWASKGISVRPLVL